MIYIVMGVSGCGKTTVGRELARQLGLPFFDADDFHPAANVEKMRAGTALTDSDRRPWLELLGSRLIEWEQSGGAVVACSALKESYRTILGAGLKSVTLIYLRGSRELIGKRLLSRTGHYFNPVLLDTQFAALEEPLDAVVVGIDQDPVAIVGSIMDLLYTKSKGGLP